MTELIKKISLFLLTFTFLTAVAYSQDDVKSDDSKVETHDKMMKAEDSKTSDEPAGVQTADGMLYGTDYDPTMNIMTYGELLANTEANNNTIVVVKGIVADVCQAMGCWVTMSDGVVTTRATTSHKFVLPKDIAGKEAVIYGTFKFTEISESDARHYNEESKNPVDNATIVGPQKVYAIDAIGIKILNPASDSN